MRKVALFLSVASLVAALLALVALQPSRAYAQDSTPTPTATCDPTSAMNAINAMLEPSGDDAHDVSLLKQARDIINGQLGACNFPTETPIPTDTKVGTLGPNEARTATRSAVNDQRTGTAVVKTATASFIAQYKTIARGELASYADKHIGEKIKIQGRVFNIVDDQDMQIFLPDGVTAVYITSTEAFSGIYENDYVTIYGTVDGFFTGTNTMGGTIQQPQVAADLIVKGG